jgi:hypothetical protein
MGEKKEKILDLSGRLLARNTLLDLIGQVPLLFFATLTTPLTFQDFRMESRYA